MNNLELQKETLSTVKGYIPNLIKGIDSLYSYIQSNDAGEAMTLFNDLLEGIEWLFNAINLTKDAQVNMIDTNELNTILIEIEKAVTIKDNVLLGDILLFELKPLLEKWNNEIM